MASRVFKSGTEFGIPSPVMQQGVGRDVHGLCEVNYYMS
jgi:hypothetical protein